VRSEQRDDDDHLRVDELDSIDVNGRL